MKSGLVSLVLLPVMMAQAAPQPDPLDALVADSPFVPPAGGMRAATAGAAGPLELRGIVFVDGGYRFSIYDQGSKEANWVGIGERGYPFVARSFNREKDSLTIEHQGRTVVLALQPAKMGSGGGAPPPQSPPALPGPGDANNRRNNNGNTAAANQPAPTPGNPSPANLAPGATPAPPPPGTTNSVEAQRLQNLADEIRRRRGTGPPINLPKN